jgi:hypothetical protein
VHRLVGCGGAALRCVAGVRGQHVVKFRNREIVMADQRIVDRMTGHVLDVAEPSAVIAYRIDRQPDYLAATLANSGSSLTR